ncbi:MAG TPA: hypothetical protein VEI01_12925 [Terriglobales bacterium]|nr:hypothetical protein [Terriglobales bacterium]
MTQLGIAITFANALLLALAFWRCRRSSLCSYGWVGLAMLLLAEGLLFHRLWPVTLYFTPIAWTAYLLLVDAMVLAVSGKSRLHDEPRGFLLIALLSIPLWLIFEAYNLRLANWTYVGLPHNRAAAWLGYAWSFATITPAMFETADLIEAFRWFPPARPVKFSTSAQNTMIGFGAACLIAPLLAPQRIATYLFGLVWVGFVFLLDPINLRLGRASLIRDLAEGRRSRFYALLLSGWICAWFWEFWNYWAQAKWHYVFPIWQQRKIFEMPALGYLGFLPFALECFVMYTTAVSLLKFESPPRRN